MSSIEPGMVCGETGRRGEPALTETPRSHPGAVDVRDVTTSRTRWSSTGESGYLFYLHVVIVPTLPAWDSITTRFTRYYRPWRQQVNVLPFSSPVVIKSAPSLNLIMCYLQVHWDLIFLQLNYFFTTVVENVYYFVNYGETIAVYQRRASS